LVAVLTRPELWPWAVGGVAANHALLTTAGLLPRSKLLGENWTRLPPEAADRGEIALTFDDGPDPDVTPRVLELLGVHRARASFFCIGERAARHRDLCRQILEGGHQIENHTHRHRHDFAFMGRRGFLSELQRAQATLAEITGRTPLFFRAPAGLRNPLLDPVLQRLDLRLASWTRRGYDTCTGDSRVVERRLLRGLGAGDLLLLHDGNAARTPRGVPVVLEVLPRLLAAVESAGLRPVTLGSLVS
jgi:peptidoglycan/xylan/chitin deacetylase (PgdA/CDA1 family)